MKRNWKIHAIAVGSICVLVVALYFILGPKKHQAPVHVVGDRFVQIYTATWGANCNDSITQYNQQTVQNPRPETNTTTPAKPLTRVTQDNVLSALSDRCNSEESCKLTADSKTLGVEPIVSCFKHLVVGYRCYAYDKLSMKDVSQGDTLSIDCTGNAPAANGPAPANK